MNTAPQWALSDANGVKWHLATFTVTGKPRASCSHSVRLIEETLADEPMPAGNVCGRCKNIEWQRNRK